MINANNPSDDDLKQMFTYNLHWEANKSMLLYPRINQIDKEGTFHYNQLEKKCKVGFVNILDNGKIIQTKISSQIVFNKLISSNE